MFLPWGDQLRGSMRTVDTQSLPDSVITENESIIPRLYATPYNDFTQIWHANITMQRHWAASFLLPFGSIFILGMVVLLMVLFKRYPHVIAAIVAAILGIIIILTTVISLNYEPIYV